MQKVTLCFKGVFKKENIIMDYARVCLYYSYLKKDCVLCGFVCTLHKLVMYHPFLFS